MPRLGIDRATKSTGAGADARNFENTGAAGRPVWKKVCYQDDTSSCYGFSADLQEPKTGGNSAETCGFIIQIREKNDQIIIIVNPQLYKVELLKIRTKKKSGQHRNSCL